MSKLFKKFGNRLNALQEEVRELTIKYAEEYYRNSKISKEEAIEKGISKAEMDLRDL